ncbi:hypothetical protein DCAR_0935892 [Daucus carota subsp. sativus]|uniref:Uncharacterized protein n=1 Tax=Daucus carota subsp. sativus TaxID=79200 RepID=A0A175YI43_DAUCS|nr:hypothetical protein DCAR_0935892 [Daucus carota subsp. sativus]
MSSFLPQFILSYYTLVHNAFIIRPPLQPRVYDDTHSILARIGVAVSVLIAALKLKYQSTRGSPFQDHPKTMAIAIASFLASCLACKIFNSCTSLSSTFRALLHHIVRLMGLISLASLSSVIFSTSTSSIMPSLVVYTMFSLSFLAMLMLQGILGQNIPRNRDCIPVYLQCCT